MNDTKNPLQSLGILGPLVGVIVWAANNFLFKSGDGVTVNEVTQIINYGSMIFTAVTAIYGRWRASKKVTLTGK
jgi:hypothetical protein